MPLIVDSAGQVAREQCEPRNNGHASIQGGQRHGERRAVHVDDRQAGDEQRGIFLRSLRARHRVDRGVVHRRDGQRDGRGVGADALPSLAVKVKLSVPLKFRFGV